MLKHTDVEIKNIKRVNGWRSATQPNISHVTVQMYLSRICNYQCSYCSHRDNTEEFKTFDEYIELMNIIYDSVGHNDVVDFSFFGGEPTIVPRFDEILDYILRTFPNSYITLTSNGSQSLEWWKKLEKWSGRIHCFMSYQHAQNKSLDEYIKKMRWLKDKGFLYFLSIMLENDNVLGVKSAIKRFKADEKLKSNLTYASIDFDFNEEYDDIKSIMAELDYNIMNEQEYALKVDLISGESIYFNDHMSFKTLNLHKFKYFRCNVGKENILLDSNGDIYVCLSHILSDKQPLGNVYTDNKLTELANGQGVICEFDECVSEIWIKKERIMGLKNEKSN